MKRQIKILIYVVMAISLIACGFVGFQRIQTESQYKDVEIAVKYADILRTAEETGQSVDDVLNHYKELGVTTLLAKEMTVASAIDKDYTTYKGLGLANLVDGYILRFNHHNATQIKPDSRYIVIEDAEVAENILEQYRLKGVDLEMSEMDDAYYIEIGDQGAALTTIGVGFDTEALNHAADLGFTIALQIKTWANPSDESIAYFKQEIEAIHNVETIYFADSSVLSTESASVVDLFSNYQLGFIEFSSTRQEGFGRLAKATSDLGTEYNVVRLHTIEDSKLATTSVSSLLERYELALKERNNRVFLFKMPIATDIQLDTAYMDESITGFIQDATEAGYTITNHVPDYNLPVISGYLAVLVGLGAIMVFILYVDALGFTKTGYVLGLLGLLGYIGLLFKATTFACQAMALFGSIMFPTYALVKGISYEEKNIKESIIALIKICLISFGGVLTTIGCLSRTSFALGIDLFMGVKVATVMPIILVLFYFIFTAHRFDFKYYKGLLDKKISYGAVIVIAILAVVLYIYVSRTGNTGTATGFERAFRQFLDNVLGVRPRTKEFLISYPILLAFLYYGYKEKYIVGVIFAVIGPVSLVNTYAHIHTAVLISLIRSGYGIIFGIIIGLVLIGGIKLLGKVIKRCQIQLR